MKAPVPKRKPPIKLSKPIVAKLKSSRRDKPEIFWDSELRGFGVLVSGKTRQKSYVVQYGSIPRRTVGRCDLMSLDHARADAVQLLAKIARGIDPKKERREALAAQLVASEAANKTDLSLRQVFDSFAAARKDVREVTISAYRRLLENYVSDWLDRPIRTIGRDDIERRHTSIADGIADRRRTRLSTGHASANSVMRVLRITWNYCLARELVPGLGTNPVSMLSKIKGWYPEIRRETIIPQAHLGSFYVAVRNLENGIHRDLILLMLFTGLRVGEATSLRWQDIDFSERLLRIPAERTKSRRRLDLPMSAYVEALLRDRRTATPVGEWVFPGNGKGGHTKEPKAALARTCRQVEIPYYSPHDLRRTFITVAESCDISVYALKGLVNHSTGTDVTAGYVQLGTERLREAAERVSARLQTLIGPMVQFASLTTVNRH